MTKIEELKSKYKDHLLEHPYLRVIVHNIFVCFLSTISAFLLAYNYRAFIHPIANVLAIGPDGSTIINSYNLISGGVTGMGQTIILALEKFGIPLIMSEENVQSIIYFALNIPLFILAFLKIGKRFSILSIFNVMMTSVFIAVIPQDLTTIFNIQNDLLARAIFAGVCTGLATSIAVSLNHSTGGTDIISLYFGLKKGVSIGKYVMFINTSIVVAFTILASINTPYKPGIEGAATIALYTIVIFFTSGVIIDKLSTRDKKVQLQVITSEPRLSKVLIQNFPHGCTVIDGKGAYMDTDKKVILTVISSFELKRATEIIHKIDRSAFITVYTAYRVYGKFYIKPMK